ncbi:hypothetical protein [Sphingomonas sp. PP-CC-3A-396]|uniref:hypothetical protein n=1 Tax=Sphingomonas sp. PP-CC-3A-396 TaxID=2135655 RepID=UPI001051D09E|nr:hypothetical protein [Sphingomonas sp. PP-CC-3A-396]
MATPTIEISTKVVKLAAGAAVPPPTPTLTLTGPLGFTAGAASGTLVANIGNVPTGVTPTLTPNDGRLAIAGDATNGWKVVVGLSASAAGTINLTVSATGATATGAGVAVAAAIYITIPNYATIAVGGDSFGTGVGASPATTNGWAYLLAAALGAALTNSSVPGSVLQRSADAGGSARPSNLRDNYGTYLLGTNKKLAAFIALGYNDARYVGASGTFNVAQYISDYREIINGLILGGYARAEIYIISPWYITDLGLTTGSTGFAGQSRAGFEAFVPAAASVAAEFGVNYTDAYNPLNIPAYIADVDGNDRVHPRNFGHNLIFTTVRDKTIEANKRAAPAVTVSASGQTVTVVASAVSGAASYEYVLVANPINTAGNTSGTFTNVAAGTYYAKARAVFGDGVPGPWSFTAASVTVAAAGNTLNTLTLSGAPKNGAASTGTINGATAGSSIVSNVSGLTVDSAARTYAFDGTTAAATITNGLVETLAGANGSPKSSPVTVAPAGSTNFVQATFTGTDGTLLTAYTPEAGTSFVAAPTTTTRSVPQLAAGRIWNPATGTSVASVYRATAAAPSPDHYAEIVIDFLSAISTETIGVGIRMDPTVENYVWGRYNTTANGFQLFETTTVNGTTTSKQLGAYADTFTSGSRTLRVTGLSDKASLSVDGVERVAPTTTAVLAGVYVGIRSTEPAITNSATVGRQITSLTGSAA